jgi:hypothetical protein
MDLAGLDSPWTSSSTCDPCYPARCEVDEDNGSVTYRLTQSLVGFAQTDLSTENFAFRYPYGSTTLCCTDAIPALNGPVGVEPWPWELSSGMFQQPTEQYISNHFADSPHLERWGSLTEDSSGLSGLFAGGERNAVLCHTNESVRVLGH